MSTSACWLCGETPAQSSKPNSAAGLTLHCIIHCRCSVCAKPAASLQACYYWHTMYCILSVAYASIPFCQASVHTRLHCSTAQLLLASKNKHMVPVIPDVGCGACVQPLSSASATHTTSFRIKLHARPPTAMMAASPRRHTGALSVPQAWSVEMGRAWACLAPYRSGCASEMMVCATGPA